jgi:cytochrome c oxidase cbb3-type subunit I/II
MLNPRDVSPGSNMPNYPWLFTKRTKVQQLVPKINAMRRLGVPYEQPVEEVIMAQVKTQSEAIVNRLAEKGAIIEPDKQIVALIAYLQKLGSYEDLKAIKSAGQ